MGRCALDRIPQTGAGFCVENALERLSTGRCLMANQPPRLKTL